MAVVGIDLGTTYSAIAHLDKYKKPVILPNADGDNFTPSVVYFESKDNIVVGKSAKNASEAYPKQIVQYVKNEMGKKTSYEFFGDTYNPPSISAIILTKLRQDAEQALGTSISGAVITVPAIFGEAQRHATKEAAKIAGLEVIAILDEPVAAALAYGLSQPGAIQGKQNILIYDLGGGTFDLTILQVSENEIKELHTGGNRLLGGKLWDDEIIKFVADRFRDKHDTDPRDSPDSRQTLRLNAENAKRDLTNREKTKIKCDHEGESELIEISREQFEELTASLLRRTEVICELAIDEMTENQVISGWDDIHQVVLVGGSSRMPQVKKMIQSLSGKEAKLVDPDLAVAKGAALFSEMELLRLSTVSGDDSKLREHGLDPIGLALVPKQKVLRVSSFALGNKTRDTRPRESETVTDAKIEGPRYINSVLIPRNTPLPAKGEGTFYTIMPNQRAVDIEVLEGEDPDPKNCVSLGMGSIEDIPSGLPDSSPIEVQFELTEESLIRVTAVETTYGTKCQFELKRESGLSDTDIIKQATDLASKRVE